MVGSSLEDGMTYWGFTWLSAVCRCLGLTIKSGLLSSPALLRLDLGGRALELSCITYHNLQKVPPYSVCIGCI